MMIIILKLLIIEMKLNTNVTEKSYRIQWNDFIEGILWCFLVILINSKA